jgi:8-oxo-dGTP diphosphatase
MPPDDSTGRGPIPLGPVGGYLIENLKDLRNRRQMTYKDLSARLKELGRPIPTLGLSRIERGERRVDADDLVALALALGVNPSALLLPRSTAPDQLVDLTEDYQARARDAWNWADARAALPFAGPGTRSTMDYQVNADFVSHGRPLWAPLPEALEALGFSRQQGGLVAAQPIVEDLATRPIPVEEGKDRPVVAAIVAVPGRGILISERREGKVRWGFITGEIEPDESPKDAAEREVKEETGLEVAAGRIIGERNPHPVTGKHMIYMAATPVEGTAVFVGDEEELADVLWVSLAEADERMPGMFGPVREHLARELGEG